MSEKHGKINQSSAENFVTDHPRAYSIGGTGRIESAGQ
jgi:hypothetical protein